jgi:hypothetical protein
MAFNIEEIRSQLTLGGARPSLFQVTLTNPVNGVADLKTPFMVRATAAPASTLGTIRVPYFGRTVKLAGDRTYEGWDVTVMNDEDFLVRNALEQWSHAINSAQGNVRALGSSSPLLYKSTAEVTQFSKTGAPLRTYRFNGIYPATVSNMDLDWGATDTIQEFRVRFEYDFWEVSGGVTGNAGGI